jgi:chemotaxis protein MotA
MNLKSLDFSTVAGIVITFVIITIAIKIEGNILAFVDPSAILIVILGTFAITTACFSLSEILIAQKTVFYMLFTHIAKPSLTALRMVKFAEFARTVNDLRQLEPTIKIYEKFFQRGIMMIIDGHTPEMIEKVLTQEIISTDDRNNNVISILRKSAEIAPAMGLIGTIIGLVQMLGSLNDPSKIGPYMAIALLTTFYGAVLAYIVFFPLASKIERLSQEESLILQIYFKTILSVAKRENPRYLEEMLNSLLHPAHKINYFS